MQGGPDSTGRRIVWHQYSKRERSLGEHTYGLQIFIDSRARREELGAYYESPLPSMPEGPFFRFPFPRSRGDAIYPCSRTMGGDQAIQRERRGRACLMSLGLMGSRNADCSSSKEKQRKFFVFQTPFEQVCRPGCLSRAVQGIN